MYFREEIDKMKEASFDFGKKPPVDGYTKVTEKSVYTKEKGFGLSEVAEADERKIGEKELNRDFLFMGGKSFIVDIENGEYIVRVSTGDYVGILDADLQHSPELIPEMLSALEEGYEIAAARRVDRSGEGKVKSVFSRAFYKVINRMSDVDIQDGAQDFRIMKRQVVEAILSMPEYNRFSKGIFSWVGFRTKWFEHENRERAAGSSKWSFAKLFRYALDGIIGFSTAPLKVSLYIGVASSGIGVIYALYILIRTLIRGSDVPGYPSIICAIFFFGGLILCSLGVIGEYLARIYLEVKRRPIFLVAETNIIPGPAETSGPLEG